VSPSIRLQLCGHYELDPLVGLRDEQFGALAYHYGNRRLTFLNDPRLAQTVRSLPSYDDLAAALTAAGVTAGQQPAFVAALQRLADAEVLRDRDR
jgi:putative mycofactocin binding protein MftB